MILAGIGAALGSSRARASGDKAQIKHARLTLVKRALILLVIGYAWLWLWTGDILHFYGIYLLFGAALLTVRDRYLWLVLVGSVLIGLLFLIFGDYAAGWSDDGSYGLLSSPWAIPRELFLNGLHPVFPWVGFYILGMLLGRSNLRNQRNLLIIAIVAGVIALVAELIGLFTVGKFGWSIELADTGALGLLSAAPLPPTPIYLLAAGGTAVALISTLLLIINRFPNSRLGPAGGVHWSDGAYGLCGPCLVCDFSVGHYFRVVGGRCRGASADRVWGRRRLYGGGSGVQLFLVAPLEAARSVGGVVAAYLWLTPPPLP